ncbi:MAG: DUF962 domain-containing protein [Roseateles depolymerans]|uniref:DUF962 domain-containing protein n=1 Tax=Roseateles depolymerans TaxID=76731 RepID=A0A2W5DD87_9BURK|nr:MAG: DUF962 domain-containing protein [Roseateles depolymerans]
MAAVQPPQSRPFSSFGDFYPYYLREHSHRVNRRLHFIGSTLVLGCLWQLLSTRDPVWVLAGLLCGYGFAWIGHFFIEKNRPATFRHPIYSLMGDWVMYRDIWLGRVKI